MGGFDLAVVTYRLAIFDFDGTLADSYPFFTSLFDELAAKHGFDTVSREEAEQLRHRNARDVMRHVGLPLWKLPIVTADFIARMRANSAAINRFDGIDDALADLAARGIQLAVVSSNAEDNVRAVLGEQNSRRFAQLECGMSMFGKATRIRRVLKRANIAPQQALYIGDQLSDLDAAHAAGVPFGAVAWGYGTIESMQARGAAEIFHDVRELARIA